MFCSTVIPSMYACLLHVPYKAYSNSNSPLLNSRYVIHTNGRDKSVARNSGTAVAFGKYIHFLDDDDWLLPGALKCFWELAGSSEAELLYGSSQLVDRVGNPLMEFAA